jgi:hypothetical protein
MRSKWVLPLFACLGLSLTISGQGVQAVQVKSITLPVVFGSMSPVGNWSGSAIIQVENPRSAAPIIRAFDRNGQKIGEFTLAIPGANLIKVHSGQFVRGSDGSFALAGHVYTADSRGTSFVAWISAGGTHQTVIRLSPYLVYSIAIAPDGTIWTVGGVEAASQRDYDLLRRFDRTGKLLGSMIPNGSLKITDTKRFVDAASESSLASSSTNVAWYSEAAGIYVLFALDGSEIARIATPNLGEKMTVHGLALCDDGRAYSGAKLRAPLDPTNALGVVQITGNSAPVFTSLGHSVLYGCDGSSLVAYSGQSSFAWYDLPMASR